MLECGAAIGDTAHVSGECSWLGQVDLSIQPAATEFAKNQHPNSKQLKFGIDAILSSEYPVNCGKKAVESDYCSRYCNNSFHYCYQFDHLIATSSSFCPPLFISTTPFLPTARKYTNFVIETERNTATSGTSKRKRIWSRAVFSKLQRKGLEKRFQVQKYIMKPDRKQLAATLGLTDAQVKVWFQNRRMKWRNRKENSSNKNIPVGTTKQT